MLDQANEDTNADADVYVMQPSGLYDLNIEISELFSTEPVQYDLSLISLSFSSLGGVARNFPGVGGGGGGGGEGLTLSQTQGTYHFVMSTSPLFLVKVTFFWVSRECGGRDKPTK